jgi:hypothetical protein
MHRDQMERGIHAALRRSLKDAFVFNKCSNKQVNEAA